MAAVIDPAQIVAMRGHAAKGVEILGDPRSCTYGRVTNFGGGGYVPPPQTLGGMSRQWWAAAREEENAAAMLTITPGRQQYAGGNGPTSRAPCVDPRVAAAQHFYGYAAAAAVSAMLQRNGTYVDGSDRRALERLTTNATGVTMTHLKRVAIYRVTSGGEPQ